MIHLLLIKSSGVPFYLGTARAANDLWDQYHTKIPEVTRDEFFAATHNAAMTARQLPFSSGGASALVANTTQGMVFVQCDVWRDRR